MSKKKPLSVGVRDTKNAIINVLNESGLPIDLLDYIMREIGAVVKTQAENVYRQELEEYRKDESDETDNG